MAFPLSTFDHALETSMRSDQEDIKSLIRISTEMEEIEYSNSIDEEVQKAIETIEKFEGQLRELDQLRADLGLSDAFLKEELVALGELKENMALFFENELKKAAQELALIENAKEALDQSELIVARQEEKKQALLSFDEQRILSSHCEEKFEGDFDWKKVRALPYLKKVENLPPSFEKRAALIAQYEEIREAIEGNQESCGFQTHAISLRKQKEVLVQQKEAYLESLLDRFDFDLNSDYSKKLKYLKYPREEFLNANLLDVTSSSAFEELKALGVNIVEGVREHFQLEVVEAYLRMKLFKEYCHYIDLRYGVEEDFFDSNFEEKKKEIKLEIANALNLSIYFWNTQKPLDLNSYTELTTKLKRLNEMVPKHLRDQLNQLHISPLVETLHSSGLICAYLENTSSSKDKKKQLKIAENIELFVDPSQILDTKYRSFFKVGQNSNTFIDKKITEYIREKSSEFDLSEVLPIVDAKEENLFFKEKYPSYFYTNEHKVLFENSDKQRAENLSHFLEGLLNVEMTFIQKNSKSNIHLSGFATNAHYYLDKEPNGYTIKAYKKKLSAIESQVNALIEKLPIGVQANETVIEKLGRIADFLQQPSNDIQEEIKNRAYSLDEQIKALESHEMMALDQIRDFFKEYVRLRLKERYNKHENQIQIFEKERALKAEDIDEFLRLTHAVEQENLEIAKLNQKTAEFASSILKLYKKIYDINEVKSFPQIYASLAQLPESQCDFQLKQNSLVNFKEIAPNLLTDINQVLIAIKTDLAMRAYRGCIASLNQAMDYEKALGRHRITYQASSKVKIDQVMRASITDEAKKRWHDRRVTNLNARVQECIEFDPRSLLKEKQTAFYAQKHFISPHMQLWLDAKAHEEKILFNTKAYFDNRPLEKEASAQKLSLLKEKKILPEIEKAITLLDQEHHFFELEISQIAIPHHLLIPILFGVEKSNHFFNTYSSEEISSLVVFAYEKTQEVLLNKYAEELDEISMNSLQKESIKTLALQKSYEEEILKKVSELEELKSSYALLKNNDLAIKNQAKKNQELEIFKEEILEACALKAKMKEAHAHLACFKKTLENPDLKISHEARQLLIQKRDKKEKEEDLYLKSWAKEYEEIQKNAEKLGLSTENKLENLLSDIEKEINLPLVDQRKIEEGQREFEKKMDQLENEIKIARLELNKTQITVQKFEKERNNKVRNEEYQKAYEEFTLNIRRRALESAYKIFALPFPHEELFSLDYFKEKAS